MARDLNEVHDIVSEEAQKVGLQVTDIAIQTTVDAIRYQLQPLDGFRCGKPALYFQLGGEASVAMHEVVRTHARREMKSLADVFGVARIVGALRPGIEDFVEQKLAERDAVKKRGSSRGASATFTNVPHAPLGRDWLTAFADYTAQQRHDCPLKKPLTKNERIAASNEWSRQLREKSYATKERERHQVVVDLDWD